MHVDCERIQTRLRALWGVRSLPAAAGVLHVVATWCDGGCDGGCDGERGCDQQPAARRVIRITEDSPKSETDFFLLNLARARADVIVTTGKILRDEPELAYSLPTQWDEAMQRWRAEIMGRTAAPVVAILTSGRDLDPEHPALHGWARPVVLTSDNASCAVRSRLGSETRVIGLKSPGPHAAIAWARSIGATTIAIEAGPSTARALYADPLAIDELWLSEYLEPQLAPALRGDVLFDQAGVPADLRAAGGPSEQTERSGRWRFQRFAR